ncbi:hypothetical protein GCM10025869_14980 [Homoserinibacter gongjuensis]|uniref:Uncharacterized protein n=1 Tax=Homoserinibacter gongjuensis TaxID=1162968 RepID=A0ABQ6JUL6_9MICO|nr:hypothetical protein GCM10025869_14980 [Homoserinibacter gongjuensis]
MRCEQPLERGHDHDSAVVGHGCRERLDLLGAVDDAEGVAHPLHERSRDRDGAFEGVTRRLTPQLIGNRRDEAARRGHGLGARVGQQEAAGAVGALRLPGCEHGLAERGRLLIAEDARDGQAGELGHGIGSETPDDAG